MTPTRTIFQTGSDSKLYFKKKDDTSSEYLAGPGENLRPSRMRLPKNLFDCMMEWRPGRKDRGIVHFLRSHSGNTLFHRIHPRPESTSQITSLWVPFDHFFPANSTNSRKHSLNYRTNSRENDPVHVIKPTTGTTAANRR